VSSSKTYQVSFNGGREAKLVAPQRDYIERFWKRGRYYEAGSGELLDLIAPLDVKVYVDVGAQWGNHAAFMAHRAKELHLFEPLPLSYEALKVNTKPWADKCSYYNVACGAMQNKHKLEQITAGNIGTTRVDFESNGSTRIVPLDDFKNIAPDFIKIDVDGLELGVLFGAMYMIGKYRPYVACEVAENRADIDRFMMDRNYDVIETKNATRTHLYVPRA